MTQLAKILLVDDDVTQRKLSRAILEGAGYLVETTAGAQEALAAARRTTPDVIVSDVLMGDIDGFGLCRKLREDERFAGIPIVLLSAHYGGRSSEELAKKVGAYALVERTPTFERELRVVQRCLWHRTGRIPRVESAYEEHLKTNADQLVKLVGHARLAEQRMTMLFDFANDLIAILSTEGVVLEANNRWEELVGIDPIDMIGKHLRDLAATGYEVATLANYKRTVERGRHQDLARLRHAVTGATIVVEFSSTVVDVNGDVQVIAIGRDVTERVQATEREAEAEAARRKLEERLAHAQKMDALGRLTGGIAHDFNNLLSVILTYGDLLGSEVGEHDPRRADILEIVHAGERAAGLTRQLLAFSRHQVLELAVVDVGKVVKDLGKMLQRLIGEDLELELVNPTELCTVRADVSQLEQVIVNLVVNARDAMPMGGEVRIATSLVEIREPATTTSDLAPGPYVLVEVRDSGCGMDAATLGRLFEPFFTTKERGKGTGLGLSTSYGIVRQCGGQIIVQSEVGKGTAMRVYLPQLGAAPAPATREPVRAARGSEAVLIVEDERPVRAALARVLESRGYEVIAAADYEEAVAALDARGGKIDLIVSDVVMPKVSGTELVKRLHPRFPDARVLLISGYTDHAMLGDLAGDPHFLQKPFSPQAFVRKVGELLHGEASS